VSVVKDILCDINYIDCFGIIAPCCPPITGSYVFVVRPFAGLPLCCPVPPSLGIFATFSIIVHTLQSTQCSIFVLYAATVDMFGIITLKYASV